MAFVRDSELDSFGAYQKFALKATKDLCYGKDILIKIREAKTIGEIERIMSAARHGK